MRHSAFAALCLAALLTLSGCILRADRTPELTVIGSRTYDALSAAPSALLWTPNGNHLVFRHASDGQTLLVYLSLQDGQLAALAVDPGGEAEYTLSRDGNQMAYTRAAGGSTSLIRLPLDGSGPGHALVSAVGAMRSPAFSPDGKRLAYATEGGLWVVEAKAGAVPRLLVPAEAAGVPLKLGWLADGRSIAYVAGIPGAPGKLWQIAAKGGQPALLSAQPVTDVKCSPKGKSLAYVVDGGDGPDTIWLYQGRQSAQLSKAETSAREPEWSPDGRRLVYAAYGDSGYARLHIHTLGVAEESLVYELAGPFARPAWGPDGAKLAVWWQRPGTSSTVHDISVIMLETKPK